MAIYDFKCRNCKHEFEFMKIKSDEHAQCPKCGATGSGNLEQLPPKNTSFSLKGKGWYKDGYGN